MRAYGYDHFIDDHGAEHRVPVLLFLLEVKGKQQYNDLKNDWKQWLGPRWAGCSLKTRKG